MAVYLIFSFLSHLTKWKPAFLERLSQEKANDVVPGNYTCHLFLNVLSCSDRRRTLCFLSRPNTYVFPQGAVSLEFISSSLGDLKTIAIIILLKKYKKE